MSQSKPSNPLLGIGIVLFILITVLGIGNELWTRYVASGKVWPTVATSPTITAPPASDLHTIAPVGKWSEVIDVLPSTFYIYAEGPVKLRTNDGHELNTDKNVTWDIGMRETTSLQFQSRTQTPVSVRIDISGPFPPLTPPPFSGSVYEFDLTAPTDAYTDILNMPSCCSSQYDVTGETAVLVNESEKMISTVKTKDRVLPDVKTLRFRSLETTPLIVHFKLSSNFPDRIRENPVLDMLGKEHMIPFTLLIRPEKWSDYVGIPYSSSLEWQQENNLPFQVTDGNGKNINGGMVDGKTASRIRFIALTEQPIELTVTLNVKSPAGW